MQVRPRLPADVAREEVIIAKRNQKLADEARRKEAADKSRAEYAPQPCFFLLTALQGGRRVAEHSR
jgi:hypothetical protein